MKKSIRKSGVNLQVLLAIPFIAVVLLFGCQKKQQEDLVYARETEIAGSAKKSDTIHTARNSLDYIGTYKGVLPSASGGGVETTITLRSDGISIKKTKFLGRGDNGVFESYAAYMWNNEGSVITLEAIPPPNSYFVGENILIQLDIEGKRITGDLADSYILRKE